MAVAVAAEVAAVAAVAVVAFGGSVSVSAASASASASAGGGEEEEPGSGGGGGGGRGEILLKPPESFDFLVPLGLSLLVFGSAWIYISFLMVGRNNNNIANNNNNDNKKTTNVEFARAYKVHTLHHVVALGIAALSLSSSSSSSSSERDENIEYWGIMWSVGYFVVDIVDCVVANEGHLTYTLHGAVCLVLGLCNYNLPLLYRLKMNSRAAFIETSSILLYQVKQYRHPVLFLIFAAVYTLCRIVWIPYGIMKPLLEEEEGMRPTDLIFVLLVGFYLLQIWWWIKILRIIAKGSGDDDDDDGDTKKKKKKTEEEEGEERKTKKKTEKDE
eukprot:CAMPEP_0113494512 /NCGR_PEP_ID=MMETSP0014_2-20120614/29143_1 /TAXON_ID=2857 /ORGANISM="Nitzschia sp." /LENGTH=328 /DNA_ID=CAMNT_0000388403 /DNA_START=205 /DNA_END=1191 /DNA_ORIENTATION=- /assembly_acc=CAM_ASM_000159